MSAVYLDTHIAIALYAGLADELSRGAKLALDSGDLLLSPMAVLASALNASFGVAVCRIPFALVAMEAIDVDWTTDLFDRLIVAQAIANSNAKLITRDRLIRHKYPQAVW